MTGRGLRSTPPRPDHGTNRGTNLQPIDGSQGMHHCRLRPATVERRCLRGSGPSRRGNAIGWPAPAPWTHLDAMEHRPMAVLCCLPLSAFVAQCPAATCTAAVASFALTGWAFLAGGKLSTPRAADSCLQALSRALCCAVAASISTAPLTGPSRSTSPTALLCRPSTCAAWWTAPPAAPLRLFASSPPRRFAASPPHRLAASPPHRPTAAPGHAGIAAARSETDGFGRPMRTRRLGGHAAGCGGHAVGIWNTLYDTGASLTRRIAYFDRAAEAPLADRFPAGALNCTSDIPQVIALPHAAHLDLQMSRYAPATSAGKLVPEPELVPEPAGPPACH